MTDNKNEKRPQDANRINVNEDYEIRYWTKTLNVSEETLRNIVNKVGVMVEDVKRALKDDGTQRA